jgi:hypothetical protein
VPDFVPAYAAELRSCKTHTTERVFVNAEGVKRGYKFKPSDSRVFEEQTLERQLRAAAFLPATKDDMDAYSLTEGERRGPPTFQNPQRDDRRHQT